jgi:hypothetical protein
MGLGLDLLHIALRKKTSAAPALDALLSLNRLYKKIGVIYSSN